MAETVKCPVCKKMFVQSFHIWKLCQPCDIDQRIARFEKRMREVQAFMRTHLDVVSWEKADAWAKRKKVDLAAVPCATRQREDETASIPATALVLHPTRKPMNEKLVFVFEVETVTGPTWTFWWAHASAGSKVRLTCQDWMTSPRHYEDARDCRAAAIMATWAPYLSF